VPREKLLGQSLGLATEHQKIAITELRIPETSFHLRGEEKEAGVVGLRGAKRIERFPNRDGNFGPVIEPGAAQRLVIERKSERLDKIEMRAGCEAEPSNVSGIRRNLGFDQDDVQHPRDFTAGKRAVSSGESSTAR